MKTRYKIWKDDLLDYSGASASSIVFTNCTNLQNIKPPFDNFTTFTIYSISTTRVEIRVSDGTNTYTFVDDEIDELIDGDYCVFDANATGTTNINSIVRLINNDVVIVNQDNRILKMIN